jgi:hypothetical protein
MISFHGGIFHIEPVGKSTGVKSAVLGTELLGIAKLL